MAKQITWSSKFTPSYTPMEMLDLGIFEGIYTFAIKGIPSKYTNHKNVLKRGDEPDITINKFKVKSRQSLKVWKENNWVTENSPLGWFEWYVKYFEGRRIPGEDKWQIGRFNSFVARHQGQINNDPKSKNKDHRVVQKQALLQWAWDWETKMTDKQNEKNLNRISKLAGVEIESEQVISKEDITIPHFIKWI
jgi:hypothetical protein